MSLDDHYREVIRLLAEQMEAHGYVKVAYKLMEV